MNHEILVYNQTRRRVPEKLIKLIISKALKFLKMKQQMELAVLIVNKSEVKRLNKIWRGKNELADELSFGLNSRQMVKFAKRDSGMVGLGEIVVNVDKISDRGYLSKILVHSLLHLLGHHHEKSAAEAKKMEHLEKQILKKLEIRN